MRLPARAIFALAVAFAATAASGAPREWPDALTGRLREIKAAGTVRLGFRENAIPFSYLGPDAKPVGYSLDICRAIVTTIAEDLGVPALAIEHVRVTALDRIEKVVSGAVDLECGSTSITAARRREVAFSPAIFVTGTRIAVPRGSAIRDAAGLRGRTVAVVRGTTNEAVMHDLDRLRGLGMAFAAADDYHEALALVTGGRADALAADEVLLRGLLAEARTAGEVRVVGEQLSFEPYGIAYRRDDPTLAEAVSRAVRTLAESREIVWIYDRWFVRPLPSGQTIGLPMSVQVRRSFELLGLPPD